MSPRQYHLGKRQEQLDDLRQRVVEAARSLLRESSSYSRFTVDAVAERADVARATVYYQFESKTGVLQAVCDALALDGRIGEVDAAFAEPDPMESIRIVIRCFARFWDFDRTAMRRLRSLARLEPEVGAVIEARDDRRRGIFEVLVNRLGPDLVSPDAGDLVRVLTTLTSFETFDSLAPPPATMAGATDLVMALAEAAVRQEVDGARPRP
jgi:AcrR family transcriptional regulator